MGISVQIVHLQMSTLDGTCYHQVQYQYECMHGTKLLHMFGLEIVHRLRPCELLYKHLSANWASADEYHAWHLPIMESNVNIKL